MGLKLPATTALNYWPVGSIPYNLSATQNTEGTGHSFPFYGFGIPATFAQIPT